MSAYLPRSAWNARPARPGPGPLVPSNVEGIAFHWPGSTSSRPISKAAVPRALRSWQDFHIDGRGWSDIAYQVAVDQWGRRWTLRGLTTQSGANGDTDTNRRFGAVLLVLVQDERPSAAMLEAARATVADFRDLYPRGRKLVGHGAIRPEPTSCPGPAVRAALRAGALDPAHKEEWTMDKKDFQKWVAETPIPVLVGPDKTPKTWQLGSVLKHNEQEVDGMKRQLDAIRKLGNGQRAALAKLAEVLAPQVAAEVVELLGERVDVTLSVEGDLEADPAP